MKFNDLYRNYFEHQAINHPDLAHDPNAEEQVYQEIEIEEAMGDFRGQVQSQGFIFRLIRYTYQIGLFLDRTNTIKRIQGGFIVAKYFDNRNDGSAGYLQALVDAERVMDEIIEKMFGDSREGHPLFDNSLDSEQEVNVVPVYFGNYAGYRCIVTFENYWRDCVEPATGWLDGGVTPFDL